MLKLLIVDDEPIIRSGIRSIIDWTRYGYTICGEAEDGESAVRAIQELKPDLVFMDLHLPGFSGLEVIRKIRTGFAANTAAGIAANSRTHFLIISGYAEFEYAQEALDLDVDGYITKPIDENTLLEKINNIRRKIHNHDSNEQRRLQFLDIIEGTFNEETGGPLLFGSGYFQAVFISADNRLSEEAPGRMQALRNYFQKDICHIFSYREFMVLLFENTPEAAVKHLLENLHSYLDKSGACCSITLGSRCQEKTVSAGIRRTCREAEELMKNIFFYRDKKYLTIDDKKETKGRELLSGFTPENNEDRIKKLSACIQAIDRDKIQSFFGELETGFSQSEKTPQEIRQICMELLIEVRGDIIKKYPASREMLGNGKEYFDGIMNLRYLQDITGIMIKACLHISECLPLLYADSGFQRIISYVNNNYYEDLRLETLGQLFNYNCAYLGKRFKEHTGKNFHTYLDLLRIEAAKELLNNSAMKVYEISQAVGYTNTDYFYSKFKKYAGESPLVYKKKQ